MTEFQYLDGGNSEAQDRLATSYLLAQSSPGLARTGVLAGLGVSQTATASGAVQVAAGASVVQESVLTGAAILVNDTTKTLDVLTANPMGALPRRDIVVFDSVTKMITVVVGVPNVSPTDPTVPATACRLARLSHAANATTVPTVAITSLIVPTRLAPAGATPAGDYVQGGTTIIGSAGALGEATIFYTTPFTTIARSAVPVVEKFGSVDRCVIYAWNPASLTSFQVQFLQADGTPAVGGSARVNWVATGV